MSNSSTCCATCWAYTVLIAPAVARSSVFNTQDTPKAENTHGVPDSKHVCQISIDVPHCNNLAKTSSHIDDTTLIDKLQYYRRAVILRCQAISMNCDSLAAVVH